MTANAPLTQTGRLAGFLLQLSACAATVSDGEMEDAAVVIELRATEIETLIHRGLFQETRTIGMRLREALL